MENINEQKNINEQENNNKKDNNPTIILEYKDDPPKSIPVNEYDPDTLKDYSLGNFPSLKNYQRDDIIIYTIENTNEIELGVANLFTFCQKLMKGDLSNNKIYVKISEEYQKRIDEEKKKEFEKIKEKQKKLEEENRKKKEEEEEKKKNNFKQFHEHIRFECLAYIKNSKLVEKLVQKKKEEFTDKNQGELLTFAFSNYRKDPTGFVENYFENRDIYLKRPSNYNTGKKCDKCCKEIKGNLYKCTICNNYYFCEICFNKNFYLPDKHVHHFIVILPPPKFNIHEMSLSFNFNVKGEANLRNFQKLNEALEYMENNFHVSNKFLKVTICEALEKNNYDIEKTMIYLDNLNKGKVSIPEMLYQNLDEINLVNSLYKKMIEKRYFELTN